MASKTEGIRLLSMYNDDEDEEDEELEEKQPNEDAAGEGGEGDREIDGDAVPDLDDSYDRASPFAPSRTPTPANADLNPKPVHSPAVPRPSPSPVHQLSQPQGSTPSAPVPSTASPSPVPAPPSSAPDSFAAQRRRVGALAIVDYAHDESAMSPEPEEGEMVVADLDMLDAELQDTDGSYEDKSTPGAVQGLTSNTQAASPQSYNQPEASKSDDSATVDVTGAELDTSLAEAKLDVLVEMQEDIDPLKKFLPPPPTTKCPQELQEKINKFLAFKKAGKSFNTELRSMKAYRNPDFLQHAVRYQEIDQLGTCFSKDVFDPQGYDKSDYYDQIEADMKRELERKEQERKRSPKVDFVSGGIQPSTVASMSKISTQVPVVGLSSLAATAQQSVSATVEAAARESRQNKKSKWDKVDTDPKNPLQSGGNDTTSTATAHAAAILSAANAGSGYTAFAQQKRREAEEKRSTERKFEKRS